MYGECLEKLAHRNGICYHSYMELSGYCKGVGLPSYIDVRWCGIFRNFSLAFIKLYQAKKEDFPSYFGSPLFV